MVDWLRVRVSSVRILRSHPQQQCQVKPSLEYAMWAGFRIPGLTEPFGDREIHRQRPGRMMHPVPVFGCFNRLVVVWGARGSSIISSVLSCCIRVVPLLVLLRASERSYV